LLIPLEIAGLSPEEKLESVILSNKQNNIDVLMVTKLEEIAYLSNMRGNEIPYSSCFKAKAAVYEGNFLLFRDEETF